MPPRDPEPPDMDALVAELLVGVEERRRQGAYPPGLEEQLAAHFRGLLSRRVHVPDSVELHRPLERIARVLPLDPARIPVSSNLPVGAAFHRTVARLLGRQIQGALEQVQSFAQPVADALGALTTALEDLVREVRDDLGPRLDAVLERQAAHERWMVQAESRFAPAGESRSPVRSGPGDSSGRRDVVGRLASGGGPVLEVGCGRGDLLERLGGAGVEAWGVETDEELVKAAAGRGLAVEHGDGPSALERLEDASLGGLVLIEAIERLPTRDIIALAALAADKLRPGGEVLIETGRPAPGDVFADAPHRGPDQIGPVHPAWLAFLFREAGFAAVETEWHTAGPEPREETGGPGAVEDAGVARLNRLLYAAQGYLLAARR